ncbi:MAG: YHYH domain-containing protein [Alphaproteobacteria bacterium]
MLGWLCRKIGEKRNNMLSIKYIKLLTNVLTAVSFSLVLVESPSSAHGGGLDSSGCHNNRKTGGYHCHQSSPVDEHNDINLPEPRQIIQPQIETKERDKICARQPVGIKEFRGQDSMLSRPTIKTMSQNDCVFRLNLPLFRDEYSWIPVIDPNSNNMGWVLSDFVVVK